MPWNLCPRLSSVTPGKILGSEDWVQIFKPSLAEWSWEIHLTFLTIFSHPKMAVQTPCLFCRIVAGIKMKKNGRESPDKTRKIFRVYYLLTPRKSCLIYLSNLAFFFLYVYFPSCHHCPLLFKNIDVGSLFILQLYCSLGWGRVKGGGDIGQGVYSFVHARWMSFGIEGTAVWLQLTVLCGVLDFAQRWNLQCPYHAQKIGNYVRGWLC